MNQSLKKEWRDTEIPEAVYRRARDRAWKRLHKGDRLRNSVPIIGTLAAATISACILLVLIPDTPPKPEPWTVAMDAAESDQSPKGRLHWREEISPSGRAGTPIVQNSIPPRDRATPPLVLRFRLPKTGIRMMWILAKEES